MVLDTSALMAILFEEDDAQHFKDAIEAAETLKLSAASLVEMTIVASGRKEGLDREGIRLLQELGVEVIDVTAKQAGIARGAFLNFGRGRHKAKLNFGDTFSYALAMHLSEPLLFKGSDFSETDVIPAV